jgi:uncharacterized membrane protein YhaH (DUF805 family)
MKWLLLFFGFRGRLDALQFSRLNRLLILLPMFILSFIPNRYFTSGGYSIHALASFVYFAAAIVPLAAIVTKRLHDADHSLWLLSPACLPLPLLLVLVLLARDHNITHPPLSYLTWGATALGYGLWIWVFYVIEHLPGSRGANRFGPARVSGPSPTADPSPRRSGAVAWSLRSIQYAERNRHERQKHRHEALASKRARGR